MKKLAFLFALLFSIFTHSGFAQQGPNVGCKDTTILKQAADIKQHYTAQGFTIFRDAMLGMESRVPYPVVMQLQQNQLYVLVFIGSPDSKRLDLDLYDANDAAIEKVNVQRNRNQPNYIIHTFSPAYSGEFLAVAVQRLKDKSMCGSFFILKLDPAKNKEGAASIVPYGRF